MGPQKYQHLYCNSPFSSNLKDSIYDIKENSKLKFWYILKFLTFDPKNGYSEWLEILEAIIGIDLVN